MALTAGSSTMQDPGLDARTCLVVEGPKHLARQAAGEVRALSKDKTTTSGMEGQRDARRDVRSKHPQTQRNSRQTNHDKDRKDIASSSTSSSISKYCDVPAESSSKTQSTKPSLSGTTNKQSNEDSKFTSSLASTSSSKPSQNRRDKRRRRANKKGQETSWVYLNRTEDFSDNKTRDRLMKGFLSSGSDDDLPASAPLPATSLTSDTPDIVQPLPVPQSHELMENTSVFVSQRKSSPTQPELDNNTCDNPPPSRPAKLSMPQVPVTKGAEGLDSTASNIYRPHLHALHRIRRERKRGVALNEENFMSQPSRPRLSIVNRKDIFHRFGEKEKEAISAFDFLDEIIVSSCPSSPIKGIQDETFPYPFTESPEYSPFKSFSWSKWTSRQRTRSRSRSQTERSVRSNRFSSDSLESPVSPEERKISISSALNSSSSSGFKNHDTINFEQACQSLSSQTSHENMSFPSDNVQNDRLMKNNRKMHQFERCRSQEDDYKNHLDKTTSEETMTWPLTWPSLTSVDSEWSHRKSLVLNIGRQDNDDDGDEDCSPHQNIYCKERNDNSKDTKFEVSQLLQALERLSSYEDPSDDSNPIGNEQHESSL